MDSFEDRKLVELAALAAGYCKARWSDDGRGLLLTGVQEPWNPLHDDGDALRLAVRLNIDLMNATPSEDGSEGQRGTFPVRGDYESVTEWHDSTSQKQEATRRVIVRAAAQIADFMRPLDLLKTPNV